MKKQILSFSKLFLVLSFFIFSLNRAQVTTIFQENFESISPGDIGTWRSGYFGSPIIYYPYHTFLVQSGCAINLIADTRSMQVTGIPSASSAVCSYQNINQLNNPGFAPLIYHEVNGANYSDIKLSYKWKCYGEGGNKGQNYDFGRLVYSLDGNNWTVFTNNIRNGNSNTVTVTDLVLPASLANTNFYIGWSFVSNGSTINNPGLTIDDITIKGTTICAAVTASASKNIICPGDPVTLTASTTGSGYIFTWYTDWNINTGTGTSIGTGSPFTFTPTESNSYRLVATKAGCSVYDYASVALSSTPTAITVSPTSAISCLGEVVQLSVTGGGIIPPIAMSENFNPGHTIPWLTYASVSGGDARDALWSIANPTNPLSFYPGWNGNSSFVIVNSDYYEYLYGPGYSITSSLISPAFSLQDYTSPINLTFTHYYRQFPGQVGTVDISTDSGLTWIPLKTYTTTVGSAANFAAETISLDLYINKPNIKMRFNYVGSDAWWWAVDNVVVQGVPKKTTVSWSPTTGLYTNPGATVNYGGGNTSSVYASPIATTTYTVSAATSVGCPSSNQITITRGDKGWNRTTGNNWNIDDNWLPTGIPTLSHCVNIPSNTVKPIIVAGTNAFAKNLTIQSGGQVSLNGNLTVTDFVKNVGSAADLVLASDGNLIQINEGNAINTGAITAKRTLNLSAGRQQYNYLISPLEGQSLKDIYNNSGTTVPFVLYHREDTNNFYNSSGAYIKGRGLAVKEPAATFAGTTISSTFTGKPTNGTFTYPIIRSTGGDPEDRGFNLVGNPYPSNIDLIKLFSENGGSGGNLDSSFYFWDSKANTQTTQAGNNYDGVAYGIFNAASPGGGGTGTSGAGDPGQGITKAPTRYVKTGQGFMVRSKIASADLKFNNTMRTKEGTTSFFGKTADSTANVVDRFWLNLISPENLAANIAIVYFPEGNNAFTQDDSKSLGGSDAVYSIVENEKVVINGRSSFVDTDVIPLGSQHFAAGNYTIALAANEGIFATGQSIYLKDKQTGIITNLSAGTYVFDAVAGESTGRFEIIYKPETVLATDQVTGDDLIVYRSGSDFIVKAQSKKITGLEVYDTSGRLVYKAQPKSTIAVISAEKLTQGLYVLRIDQNGTITAKKILK